MSDADIEQFQAILEKTTSAVDRADVLFLVDLVNRLDQQNEHLWTWVREEATVGEAVTAPTALPA